METTIEKITPPKAEKMLNVNKGNRKMRDGVAEKYADDMRNGRWTQCPVPISFLENGDVADGQHRLWAIVDSGTTQTFNVTRGLTEQDMFNIDTGLGRTLVDNARISGADTGLSNQLIGVCRSIEEGGRNQKALSNSAKMDIVTKHRAAAEFAIKNGPKGRLLNNAVVLSAIARAWYVEEDKERLHRFGDVVHTGFTEGMHESAAITCRNYMLSKGSAASTTALWRDTFLKVQNAVFYFMRGKSLLALKAINDEAYPLGKAGFKKSRADFAERTRLHRAKKVTE